MPTDCTVTEIIRATKPVAAFVARCVCTCLPGLTLLAPSLAAQDTASTARLPTVQVTVTRETGRLRGAQGRGKVGVRIREGGGPRV